MQHSLFLFKRTAHQIHYEWKEEDEPSLILSECEHIKPCLAHMSIFISIGYLFYYPWFYPYSYLNTKPKK